MSAQAIAMEAPLVCYDRQLRRCSIYAVDNGRGGLEWRVTREPFDAEGGESGIERCFPTYADAIRWVG